MITKENGFDLNIRWRFPDGRNYAFAYIALFVFLIVIYSNSFHGEWHYDDYTNIVENRHIFLKSLDWSEIKKTFYAPGSDYISRPLAYLSFALNYYFDKLNVFGYHLVNFIIHYLSSVFLFLFIFNTLKLPLLRDKYGSSSYAIALMATFFWATSPLQVTAVTYIVQRMASMGGLFYIMAMYFYLKVRTADRLWKYILFGLLCVISAASGFLTKENIVMLPVCAWLYDLLLIQGITRDNINKNIKIIVPVLLLVVIIGLLYTDLSSIMDGYKERPFSLTERLLTEPRIVIFYITLLLYPLESRLTLLHDVEISTALFNPWSTFPAIIFIIICIGIAVCIARKRPLISFCVLFFFVNHIIEGSIIPLELIYEHRNYIPSMLFFIPIVILMLHVTNYFSYKKTIQFTMVAVFTFLLAAQGHTVFMRNSLFEYPVLLWSDNAKKSPGLARPYTHLGKSYAALGLLDKAEAAFIEASNKGMHFNKSNHFDTWHNLATIRLNRYKDFSVAADLYRQALAIWDGNPAAWKGLALSLIGMGSPGEAENTLRNTVERWPDNDELHSVLGLSLLKQGKAQEAIEECRAVLRINPPDIIKVYKIIGAAYLSQDDYHAAQSYMERCLSYDIHDIEVNLALAEIYYSLGNIDDLNETVGRLMFLKRKKGWNEFINSYVTDVSIKVYTPDPHHLLQVIRCSLQKQMP